MTQIGNRAFEGCSSLAYLTMSNLDTLSPSQNWKARTLMAIHKSTRIYLHSLSPVRLEGNTDPEMVHTAMVRTPISEVGMAAVCPSLAALGPLPLGSEGPVEATLRAQSSWQSGVDRLGTRCGQASSLRPVSPVRSVLAPSSDARSLVASCS